MYKSLSLALVAALSAVSVSATNPWEVTKAPAAPATIHVVYDGANPPVAQYQRDVIANGQPQYTYDPLSISHIYTDGSVPCTFYGVDGLVLSKYSAGRIDVGPPQTIEYAICGSSGYKAKRFEA